MKYFVEQKVFSLIDKFHIYDQFNNEVYSVEGEFSFVKKLHLLDRYNQEVAFIKGEAWSFLPKYNIIIDDDNVGQVVREWTWFKPRYHIEGSLWTIEGENLGHDYTIYCGFDKVATINKQWFTFGDKYEIDINEDYNEVIALATVLAIDACLQQEAAAASA